MARGLLNDPWILFLDEPTLGLDVAAARAIRELVLDWKAAVPGRTVLLTTHYMAEADELCERIAIVDRGRILAIGTPAELKRRVQRESIFRLELDRLDGGARARAAAGRGHAARPATRRRRRAQRVAVNLVLTDDAALGGVVTALGGTGSQILALRKSEPTLEDVFVELVGRGFGRTTTRPRRPSGDGNRSDGDGLHHRRAATTRTRGPRAMADDALDRSAERLGPPVFAPPAARPAKRLAGRRAGHRRATAGAGRPGLPARPGMVREPAWLFFEILLPFLTTAAFVLVYRALQAPEAYVGFVVLGGRDGPRSGSTWCG